MPLVGAIEQHVLAGERIHAVMPQGCFQHDTTVPVLATGKCRTGRLWAYVRDDQPFAGEAAPAALFYYSPDRGAAHPEKHLAGYTGLMQADAYSSYRPPAPCGPESRRAGVCLRFVIGVLGIGLRGP